MRYVIVSVVKGPAGTFNNNLRKEIFEKFNIKSSKLPAHFTIKAPFECSDICKIDNLIENFCKHRKNTKYLIDGYDHFDDRVIFMKVNMSNDGKKIHDELIDELSKLDCIDFNKKDGKDKIFHVTVSSKKIKNVYNQLWNFITKSSCYYECSFNNICVYQWENNTWILHKEFNFS